MEVPNCVYHALFCFTTHTREPENEANYMYSTVQYSYSSKQVHSYSTVIKWFIMYKLHVCAMRFHSIFKVFFFATSVVMCRQIIAHVRKCVTSETSLLLSQSCQEKNKQVEVEKSLTCNLVAIWHHPVQSLSHVLCSYRRPWLISAYAYEYR